MLVQDSSKWGTTEADKEEYVVELQPAVCLPEALEMSQNELNKIPL